MARQPLRLSVRGFLLLLAFTVLLPLLALAGLLTVKAVEAERARAAQALEATAGGVLTVVNREVAGLIETLQTLESSPSLTTGDIAAFQQHIAALGRVFTVHIVLRDPEGRLLASSETLWDPSGPGPRLPAGQDQQLLDQRQVVVTGVHVAPQSREPVFALMTAVQRNGQVRYLLHLAPPAQRLTDVLASLTLPPDFHASVIDAHGLVVADLHAQAPVIGTQSPLAPALAGMVGGMPRIGRAADRDGQEVYFHAQRSQHGWTVVTSVLAEQIDGPRRRALSNAVFACLLLTGAAVLAAQLLGTRLAGAIGGLAVAASALDRNAAVPLARSGIREIDEVSTTLAMAAERLGAAAAQRTRDEERQRLILHELNHRVKNTLAMVQALAALAARGAPDVAAYRERLTERLQGLARTQALLTESDWTGAQLQDLLRAELGMYDEIRRGRLQAGLAPAEGTGRDRRIALCGPPVRLPAHHVVAFGMIVHELATNAAKYGALSTAFGRLEVAWTILQRPAGPWLEMVWTESGGPPVTPPSQEGFGTHMIRRGLARQLGAEVDPDWRREGLRFTLRMPLPQPALAAQAVPLA